MKKIPAALLLILAALAVSSSLAAAAPRVYLNDTSIYLNQNRDINLTLSNNVSTTEVINHTFKGRSSANNANWDVEYRVTNSSDFLLRFRVDDEVGTANDKIASFSCDGSIGPDICGP